MALTGVALILRQLADLFASAWSPVCVALVFPHSPILKSCEPVLDSP